MNFTLKKDEMNNVMDIESVKMPKYASSIINLANNICQATRPKNVGKLSSMFQEFSGSVKGGSLGDWGSYYDKQMPGSLGTASQKIKNTLLNLKAAIDNVIEHDELVDEWVKDLVYNKTYVGLGVENVILTDIASRFGAKYVKPTAQDESKGIDGYLDGLPIQVKPSTYKNEKKLQQDFSCPIVFYEKKKNGQVVVDVPDEFMEALQNAKMKRDPIKKEAKESPGWFSEIINEINKK